MSKHYTYLVIGGGSAGYAAARTALEFTPSVAVIDGAPELGGLCILRGCMPSKTLIYSAEVLHLARNAARFGLSIPHASVDMPALHERKLRTIAEFADYRQQQLTDGRFELYRSQARFTGNREVTLGDGTQLTADHILIATGSTVNTPPIPGLNQVPVWTSDDILDLQTAPESVITLGGGIVACELSQFLARIGTRVTQIQRSPHILRDSSSQAASVIENTFREEGIDLITDTQIERIEPTADGGVRVLFLHHGQKLVREARHLFNALGRHPNTRSLNLEAAGVRTLPSGHIAVNAWQQTDNPAIYAAGDVAGPHEIVHVAILQAELAARHAFSQSVDPINYDHLLGVTFTDPQIARVGPSDEIIRQHGITTVSADYPFDDHGKSILMEAKHGYVKLIATRDSGRLLAAECVSKDASELIHAMSVAISLGATAAQLLKTHWYHPTLSEIWTYPLEDIVAQVSPEP